MRSSSWYHLPVLVRSCRRLDYAGDSVCGLLRQCAILFVEDHAVKDDNTRRRRYALAPLSRSLVRNAAVTRFISATSPSAHANDAAQAMVKNKTETARIVLSLGGGCLST